MSLYNEIIEICEDYWALMRSEQGLFSALPMQLLSDSNSHQVEPLNWSFALQLVSVSVIGSLISAQDFAWQRSHLIPLSVAIHASFLTFMQLILSKLSDEVFQINYWARSMQQVLTSKTRQQPLHLYRRQDVGSSGGSAEEKTLYGVDSLGEKVR